MTREEIIKSMSLQDAIQVFKDTNCYGTMDIAKTVIVKALEQEPKSEWKHDHEILKAHSDGANEMLDKIRAEIEQLKLYKAQFITNDNKVCIDSQEVLNVIDKYKAESEDKE